MTGGANIGVFLRQPAYHPAGLSLDDDGSRAMEQAIEDGRRDAGVVVEDRGPVLVGLVRRDDDGASFVALADDLEEQVRPGLVERQVADFVQDE